MNKNSEIMMEITSLKSERMMAQEALKSHQMQLAESLNGAMGKDIDDVLSGRKKVVLTKKQKLKYKINNFLKLFVGDEQNEGF